ncbi:MAG: hypothetical protein D3905_09840 [Candidatus Electrothrix sp. AS4_5]|nr:hypothetical protein [Candidatus Electrothrix gigas]MCI5190072.1 hypothetical protein [Candidatus Electrothrix gigas]MCI5227099.1 hypothetical protein [Candidatus Electrothrix gigas]
MAACEIRCDNCDQTNSYDCADVEWECVGGSEDRSMGAENEYEAIIEDNCSCGQNITITFSCWEYPIGAENHSDIEIDGGEIIKNECPGCPNLHDEEDY